MSKCLICLICVLHALVLRSQDNDLLHVEPNHWWSGMTKSKVEILIHGEGISTLEVKVEGLDVINISKTENSNYLFVTVETKNKRPGKYPITFHRKTSSGVESGKEIVFDFELKQREPNSRDRKGFDQSDVIYLLMPDRFSNGNTSNDSHTELYEKMDRDNPGGRHGGDLQGIINHLDYIQELGATAIWSTPMMEDNDSVYSYHTYAQSDVYKIDPRFGTNEEYIRYVNEAHKRDLKVIQDVVTNHWGHMHWMMFDLPSNDWMHEFPEFTQSNFRMTTHMDPHTSKIDNLICKNGWFVKTMPDLNQDNLLVLNYLIQNTIWWIETAGLDGLRVDTYSFNSKEGIAEWTKAIMKEYPSFSIVGEVWLLNQAQIAYWQKDSPLAAIQNYNTGLPMVMDFTLNDALSKVFSEKEQGWNKGMLRVYDNFVNDFLYSNSDNLLVFFENHDTDRFNEKHPSFDDYTLALTLIATVRGIPQIYYGSEIGMKGIRNFGDGEIRRDFPGGWPDDSHSAFIEQERNERESAYFDFTRKLLNWRKNNSVIHNGLMMQYVPEKNVYVYFRYNEQESVMVIINNSPESREIDLTRFGERINSFSSAIDVLSNERIDFNVKKYVEIKGKTPYIFELNK